MKVEIQKSMLVDYKIKLRGKNLNGLYDIVIDTTKRENFDYIKAKLKKYPWTSSCKTWGEVIKKLTEKKQVLDIQQKYIVRKVA